MGESSSTAAVPFGQPMRALFDYAPSYHPLNHGSYGTFPSAVRAAREQHLRDHEARPCLFKRFVNPKLIDQSREAVTPLLGPGAHVDEVVFVPNATTGTNTVLYNLAQTWSADAGDAVLYCSTCYGAVRRNLQALADVGRLVPVEVPVLLSFGNTDGQAEDTASDDAIVRCLQQAHAEAVARGLRPRLAVFDAIASVPGVLMPWQRLVAATRALGMLSLVDGAHAIGMIDLADLSRPESQPDFFTTNLHKWLFVPRSCALLYVPFRNQKYLATTLPTSWGYLSPDRRGHVSAETASDPAKPSRYFVDVFADVGTLDYSPYLSVPAALAFRNSVCGGEEAIRRYCFDLARTGADRVAAILGTSVMDHPGSRMRDCALNNVLLPLTVRPDTEDGTDADAGAIPSSATEQVYDWICLRADQEYDTYFMVFYYAGQFWVRLSAQIYLDMDDFVWAGQTLLALCNRVNKGEWRQHEVKRMRYDR